MSTPSPFEHFKNKLSSLFDSSKCYPVIFNIFIVAMYLLCFISLYKKNTEIIGFGMLFVLHVFMSFALIKYFFFPKQQENPPHICFPMSFLDPPTLKIPLTFIITISLIFMFVSLLILMLVFGKLKIKYNKTEKPMHLGDPKNNHKKNELKNLYVVETCFIWLFIIFNEFNDTFILLFKKLNDKIKVCLKNTTYTIFSIILLIMSSYSVSVANELAEKTNTYYKPKK